MKVLMLGWELPPHNSGGLGVACYQMCKALAAEGVSIDFVLPYDAAHEIDFMQITPALPGVEPLNPQMLSMYTGWLYTLAETAGKNIDVSTLFGRQLAYEKSIDKIVKLRQFDVLHAHDWLTFRAAVRAKQMTGKPLIAHIHATEFDRAGRKHGNQLVEEIEYLGMTIADRIIAVSDYTRQTIVSHYGISPDKIEVVHNRIDFDDYPLNEPMMLSGYFNVLKQNGWRIMLNYGRLTVQKGLYNFLQAASAVIQRRPKTLVVIMGAGEQREELIELAADLGIGANVMFVDFQRGQAFRSILGLADLVVMPSISEPFGLTALEAVFHGAPALVSKQSGVAEVMQHVLKADYWDVDRMTDQMLSVMNYDGLRDTLRDNSQAELWRQSWRDAAHDMNAIYQSQSGGAVS